MSDEPIVISVQDKVAKSIATEIENIENKSKSAHTAIERLNKALASIQPKALERLQSSVSKAQQAIDRAALSNQRLATEQQKTAQAAANAARAQAQLDRATSQASVAQQNLATATARTAQAEAQAEGAALRLSAAQARAAATADRATAAQGRATAAAAAQVAQLRANELELERVTGIHDRFDAVLARNPKYQKAFAANIGETAKKAGLARHELQNLSYQVNDVVVSLGSGQRPMQVFLQQGAQIGQIFGGSGVGLGAIFKQLAGIVGSLLVRLLPFAAVIAAVLTPFELFTREFNKGLDSKKLVGDLKLTEDQLKKLKKSGEETSITFGDTFKATFQVIGRYANDYFKPVTDWVVKWWNIALDWMTNAFSVWIRATLGNWLALGNVIKAVFSDIPAAVELAAKTAANAAITLVEKAINISSTALLNSPLGTILGLGGSSVEIKLPRLELSDDAKNIRADIGDAVKKGYADANKFVTKFGKDVRAQALKNAQDRLRTAAGEDDKKKTGAKGFDRAKELAQINAELDAQAKNMFTLSTARDAANRAEEIALRFAKEGKPLRQDEIDGLRNKIQALNDAKEVQTQFDRIYQNATGPSREYNASLAAADKLLKMGAISQAQYSAEVARAENAYKGALDPLYEINKQLDEQAKLFGMLAPQREVEQQVMQAINKALQDGKPIREDEIKSLREKLKLTQQLNIESAIRDELQQNSAAQKSVNTKSKTDIAIGQVGNNGFTGTDAINALGQDNTALQSTKEYQQGVIASYTDMYAQIDSLRQADLLSDTSAIQAKMELFQQQYSTQLTAASNALGALASLQSSQNKKQAAIGKKAAIAQTIIQTYQSATSAFSALAGIPYVGPFLGAIAAAAAVAAGLANVQKIRSTNAGFREGGYTGNMPTNSIAGPVHGQEYVFDAPATKKIGVANLDAMRRNGMPALKVKGEPSKTSNVRNDNSETNTSTNYNQNVTIVVSADKRSKTPEQVGRAIRRESVKQFERSGA